MLVGRVDERREINLALAHARGGASATVALVGEAGIGKTALLDYAADQADDMRMLRARGVESEAQIPFATLFELLRPALGMIGRIPAPQAIALEIALALRPGTAHERFAVGAGTLSLLAAFAEQAPVVILLDDAHWIDSSSAQVLLFALRRLMADPIAVLVAARDDEPSFLDGAGLRTLRLGGLTADETAALVDGAGAVVAGRLHAATAGNPLALLELMPDAHEIVLSPQGLPVLVGARITAAFASRAAELTEGARQALVLAATSSSGDVTMLQRAAERLGIDLGELSAAEDARLVRVREGTIEFRHPLVRSAVYGDAPAELRRAAHQALAGALPDRDVDRRAWHLAAAAIGVDESAATALAQAGARSRARSGYATASAAFERAGRLTASSGRRVRLLREAAETSWLAGLADRATALLAEARNLTDDRRLLVEIDHLSGLIVARRGPVMDGEAILVAAARDAEAGRAVEMLAEAVGACFYAGAAVEMLSVAEEAGVRVTAKASPRTRFLSLVALGMARTFAGDAATGAEALRRSIRLAETHRELREDLQLLAWVGIAPMFLREARTGRWLLDAALQTARARAAVGVLPFLLNLAARDYATTDRWALAENAYREAIDLARESDQQTALSFGLSGLAWLQARRGWDAECAANAEETIALTRQTGARLHEVWALAALGELELGRGDPARAIEHLRCRGELLQELAIADVDLLPAAELVEAHLRLGQRDLAEAHAGDYIDRARAKGQPWSLARSMRVRGLLAEDGEMSNAFEEALRHHDATLDGFEAARTRLLYGERLRRARRRSDARVQLRAALGIFDDLAARPWAERARAELAASGVTARRRDPSTIDELTPQELQIALALAAGRTTRETAAALFISPKTVEYHLRHVYDKLGVRSRAALAARLGDGASAEPTSANPAQTPGAG